MKGPVRTALALLIAVTLASGVASACGGGGDDARTTQKARDALPQMVLQRDDLPKELQSLGSSFSTNAEAASGLGSGPTEEQLNAWGRVLGYKQDYQAGAPSDNAALTALSTSVSLYAADKGATDSFDDRVAQARKVDWKQSHGDLQEFQQQELKRDLPADEVLWLRFTGFQPRRAGDRVMVSDDQVVFRVGRVWGFLGVVSTAAPTQDDRQFMLAQVDVLVRTQIDHIKTTVNAGVLE